MTNSTNRGNPALPRIVVPKSKSGNLDEIALDEVLCNLYRVEGRATEKLVTQDEHLKTSLVIARNVLTEPGRVKYVLRQGGK